MAIDFPTGSATGATYSYDGLTYTYDGVRWIGKLAISGDTGTTGAQGTAGSQGAQGNTGAQGTAGETGAQGTAGNQGAQGNTGAQGSGETGAQGTAGSQGAQGNTGAQGTAGSQGAQGNTGATGPIGGSSGQVLYNSAGTAAGSTNLTFDATTLTFNAANFSSGLVVGYRDIPQLSYTASLTLALTDAGKHYYSTVATATTLTIPLNSSVAFPIGAAVNIINQGTGTITIARTAGVTLYLAGNSTSADRSLSSYGVATLQKVATDTWFVVGVGLS